MVAHIVLVIENIPEDSTSYYGPVWDSFSRLSDLLFEAIIIICAADIVFSNLGRDTFRQKDTLE